MNKYTIFKQLYNIHKFFGIKPVLLSKLKSIYDKPQTMMIHPNYECNFKCKYCYVQKNKKCLSFNKLKKIIKDAKKLGVGNIDILGGEPFLYPKLYQLLNYINSLKIKSSIFTNGSLITEENLKKINKKNTTIVIKTDSKNNYEYQNQPDITYNQLLDKIKIIKKNNFKLMSFSVITKKNYNRIDEILKLADKYNMSPAFERYHPVKNKEINKEFTLNQEEWNFFLKKLQQYWINKGQQKFINFYSEVNGGICSALSNNITIMQDGIVKPCPEAHLDLSYGNTNNESLIKIWKKSKKFRQKLQKSPSECKICKNEINCHGGCKIYTYNQTKTLNKKDPLCNGTYNPNYSHCGFGILRTNEK